MKRRSLRLALAITLAGLFVSCAQQAAVGPSAASELPHATAAAPTRTPTPPPTTAPPLSPSTTPAIPSAPPMVPGFDRQGTPAMEVAPTAMVTPTAASTSAPSPTPVPIVRPPAQSGNTGFVALDDPAVLSASAASHLSSDELVLGLEYAGEARAYPVQMAWYHHVINDAIKGKPFLVTY